MRLLTRRGSFRRRKSVRSFQAKLGSHGLMPLLGAGLALSLAGCGGAEPSAPSIGGVGPAPSPLAKPFNQCPAGLPLAFGPRARVDAKHTVAKAVPLLYKVGIKTEGFRITALNPASSTASSEYGQLVAHVCGRSVQERTYVATLLFPAMLPSASLSRGVLYLSRFGRGWQVWGDYPPGPQPAATRTSPPSSTRPTTTEPGTTLGSTPAQTAKGPIYLALGDSVPVWNGEGSYPNLVGAHYRAEVPGLQLVNLAVSGATTTSMLDGGQYGDALTLLKAHRGDVVLITIDIGGNDVVGCASSSDARCFTQGLRGMEKNLRTMLDGLRAAAPGTPIFGMTYYDPLLGDWLAGGTARTEALSTITSTVTLNQDLTTLYGAGNTADVQGAFAVADDTTFVSSRWGTAPVDVVDACQWLDITCHAGATERFGDDPNAAGQVQIADAFEKVIGSAPLVTSPGRPST